MRQSVRIIGPTNSTHAMNLQVMASLVSYMNVSLPRGSIRPRLPRCGNSGVPDIHLETRLFTKACDAEDDERVTPSVALDPYGTMRKFIACGDFAYTSENVIEFDVVTENTQGCVMYVQQLYEN